MHFNPPSSYANSPVPRIVRRRRARTSYGTPTRPSAFIRTRTRRLFVRPGRPRNALKLAEAAYKQASELRVLPPLWSYAHPQADRTGPDRWRTTPPGDPENSLFTTGGGEAVETGMEACKQLTLKLAAQPLKAQGHQPLHRVYTARRRGPLSTPASQRRRRCSAAGEGAPQGRQHQHSTPAPPEYGDRPRGLRSLGPPNETTGRSRWRARDTVAAVFLEPGAELRRLLPAAARLLQRRPRESCNSTDVLLVPTRIICPSAGWARCSASRQVRLRPGTIITAAKGLTSGYSPSARAGQRPNRRAVLVGQRLLPARLYLRRAIRYRGGRVGQPRHLRARGPQPAHPRQRGRVPFDAGEAVDLADRRDVRGGGTSTASNW